jgi:hypothetical protein
VSITRDVNLIHYSAESGLTWRMKGYRSGAVPNLPGISVARSGAERSGWDSARCGPFHFISQVYSDQPAIYDTYVFANATDISFQDTLEAPYATRTKTDSVPAAGCIQFGRSRCASKCRFNLQLHGAGWTPPPPSPPSSPGSRLLLLLLSVLADVVMNRCRVALLRPTYRRQADGRIAYQAMEEHQNCRPGGEARA